MLSWISRITSLLNLKKDSDWVMSLPLITSIILFKSHCFKYFVNITFEMHILQVIALNSS